MKRILVAVLGAAALLGVSAPASASTLEERKFTGYGTSKVGLALYFARLDARGQADRAGFPDCEEYFKFEVSPYDATVFWRCTR
ncbi:hypothetical protein [Amycolatopsis nigrescens]|uniref:hypothetical protein n=1 Tax=Amycolatopsis nigrescens TaxID=381445 RepID=UPI000366E811|nr:hypothetical protein [Amycolatopsis nigrescens]